MKKNEEKIDSTQYLFVLSPPYCGSTLIWNILGTSPAVSSLDREGQSVDGVAHVIPDTTLLEHPEYEVPWEFVKEKWHEKWDVDKPVLLEKTPSNIHRACKIESHFQPASFVALIRDPYAFCEGCIRRFSKYNNHYDTAELWVRCAKSQRQNIQHLDRVLQVRYEDLTEKTDNVLRNIEAFMPSLKCLHTNTSPTFTVMGQQSEIKNVNKQKVERLTPRNVNSINEVLREHKDVLSFFGYEMRDPALHSYLQAWKSKSTHITIRGIRWMKREGVISNSTASTIEELLYS